MKLMLIKKKYNNPQYMMWVMVFSLLIQSVACGKIKKPEVSSAVIQNTEAREDSMKMAEALAWQASFVNQVEANEETDPVAADLNEDAADDPAIWYNTKDPEKSLIIGTNKKAGLMVYDLSGKTLQIIPAGKINNVDLRDGFLYNGKKVPLVAGSNRSNNCITLFYINPETLELSDSILNIPSKVDTIYGLCMYKDLRFSRFYVIVNGKGGQVEQWEISSTGNKLQYEMIRSFSMPSQPEGMVADDKNNMLYLGVEEEGIFMTNADTERKLPVIKINGSNTDNANISYDIEGLALFEFNNKSYLAASIQGNFSYALFDLEGEPRYIASFVIKNGLVDGVEETDGIDICSKPISSLYSEGLLVVQDGFNYNGDQLVSQNFKYVSLEEVLRFIK